MIHFKRFLRRFRADESGSLAIETVLIIPALFWAFIGLFSIFDAYKMHSIALKASYTLGDIVSRETTPIDQAYLNGTREMLAYLTRAEVADVAIRITTVKYDGKKDKYKRGWSEALGGGKQPLTNSDVQALRDHLPVMPHNERVTVVETFVIYDPPFDTGLTTHEVANFVFTRPRYAPSVLWSDD